MEDRYQRERRLEIRWVAYSVVSHGTVYFWWKKGTREKGEWKLAGSSFSRNSFLMMEDRAQRERRVVRRGTDSAVSYGTVSFSWKTGTIEIGK
jgi:hypothetical protein